MKKQVQTLLAEFRVKHHKGGYSVVIEETDSFRAMPATERDIKAVCSPEEAICLKKLIKRYD
jgi:hypothetical protein